MRQIELLVVGAGPAGIAAAQVAIEHGLDVLLVDEQAAPGGQIYRNIERNAALQSENNNRAYLGSSYYAGRELVGSLQRSATTLDYRAASVVWRVDPDAKVCFSTRMGKTWRAEQVSAQHIILATGAMERPVPIPGWTLPGVFSVGAAQILLKSAALVPERSVLVGTGPLLYLFANQLIDAGEPPRALIDTQQHSPYVAWLKTVPAALRGWPTLRDGRALLKHIASSNVTWYKSATDVAIAGDSCVTGVSFTTASGTHAIECNAVMLHQGVVPNTQLTHALGLAHLWDDSLRCFRPRVNDWGESTLDSISIVGDGANISGAAAAALDGERVALNVLYRLGRISQRQRDQRSRRATSVLQREKAVRPFLNAFYRPSEALLNPPDDVIVCRCEEVTAKDIRDCARAGCVGPNQTKVYSRCGMGPCQGRFCALTVTEILSREHNLDPAEVGTYRVRAPIKPISLQELASLAEQSEDNGF